MRPDGVVFPAPTIISLFANFKRAGVDKYYLELGGTCNDGNKDRCGIDIHMFLDGKILFVETRLTEPGNPIYFLMLGDENGQIEIADSTGEIEGFAGGDIPQQSPHNFAGSRLRQIGREIDVLGPRDCAYFFNHPGFDFIQ